MAFEPEGRPSMTRPNRMSVASTSRRPSPSISMKRTFEIDGRPGTLAGFIGRLTNARRFAAGHGVGAGSVSGALAS